MTLRRASFPRRLGYAAAGVLVGLATVLAGAAPAHAKTARDLEWWLTPLHVAELQQQTRGDGVIVGVVDSPIDGNHPDLAGHVLDGRGADGSGNGWGTGQDARHGTEMAGIIAGGGQSGGYVGIAPGARILPVNYGNSTRGIADAIRWATDHGAKVINLSIGAAATTQPYEVDAVRYALDHDVVLVASSGNTPEDGTGGVIDPARIPGVVAVGALDQQAALWFGSEPGPEVALTAPGVDIIAPAPKDTSPSGYGSITGTSPAAAFVSGFAALIRAKYPKLNAPSVIQQMIKTAKDLGPPGRDPQYGFGVVRPLKALTDPVDQVSTNPAGAPAGSASAPAGAPVAAPVRHGALTFLVPVGIGLVLLVIVVVLVVVLATRRRRPVPVAKPPYGQPGWPPPPPPDPPTIHSGQPGRPPRP